MPRVKIICKSNQIYVKSRLGRSEEIDERELQIFNTKLIRGLVRPEVDRKKRIHYFIPNGISLRKYLQKGISKNDFFLILVQVIEVTEKIAHYNLNIRNLMFDVQHTFINEMTKEVWFVYQPIKSTNQLSGGDVCTYLRDVAYTAVFQLHEDTNFINELTNLLYQVPACSEKDIDAYIMRVYPEVYKQINKRPLGNSQKLNNKKWGSKDTELLNEDEKDTELLNEDEKDTELLNEDVKDTELLNEDLADTELLNEDEEGTALLDEENAGTTFLNKNQVVLAYLFRISNYDKISINKAAFRIGKERSYVDYFVANNNAVSRIHADIIRRGDSYFLRDNNSTNHTFVNGVMIEANQERELFDGDAIMFANEAFEFHVCEE